MAPSHGWSVSWRWRVDSGLRTHSAESGLSTPIGAIAFRCSLGEGRSEPARCGAGGLALHSDPVARYLVDSSPTMIQTLGRHTHGA